MITQEEVTILTKAIVEEAGRLGLIWQLRTATVTKTTAPIALLFDGDTVSVNSGISSMIGALTLNWRVYVMMIPPAGQYIVGRV